MIEKLKKIRQLKQANKHRRQVIAKIDNLKQEYFFPPINNAIKAEQMAKDIAAETGNYEHLKKVSAKKFALLDAVDLLNEAKVLLSEQVHETEREILNLRKS